MTISQFEIDLAPKVRLGGKEYPVPFLVPRQQRIVIPKLLSLMRSMTTADNKISTADLSTEQYDELMHLTFVALTRGSPLLKIDELLDAPINLMELVTAMQVIAEQTGVMKKATGIEPAGGAKAGELIGTASSQE